MTTQQHIAPTAQDDNTLSFVEFINVRHGYVRCIVETSDAEFVRSATASFDLEELAEAAGVDIDSVDEDNWDAIAELIDVAFDDVEVCLTSELKPSGQVHTFRCAPCVHGVATALPELKICPAA
ncbi:MAG: hypothetical protein HRU05_00900 [Oceanospirillaceae bacterium]|uniref:hypothetical protein n=1 Tax=Gilvibacter sp. TaxID=2729997 RepID=UPI0025BD6952|nr:hypothetical protein [Gilvibacter sp.]NQX77268.1 hypothetical protein [Gilvibacter sp.]NRA19015.1 hypothetical protein [Oceanospirillaceae bacterium]